MWDIKVLKYQLLQEKTKEKNLQNKRKKLLFSGDTQLQWLNIIKKIQTVLNQWSNSYHYQGLSVYTDCKIQYHSKEYLN